MAASQLYDQILLLSKEMLTAGMAQDWDRLIDLEKQRGALLAQTVGQQPNKECIPLISEIQRCDLQLREKVEGWMAHASTFLKASKS
jgi:hypothetical protein